MEKVSLTGRIEIFEAVAVEELRVLALVPAPDEDVAELVAGRMLNGDLKKISRKDRRFESHRV
jgi:hypothetical protein